MKWLAPILLPIPLALGACEVGRMQIPMAPMTLGPSNGPQISCASSNGKAAKAACREQSAPSLRP